jgi:hypothetical protein
MAESEGNMENELLQGTINSLIHEHGFNSVADCYNKAAKEQKEIWKAKIYDHYENINKSLIDIVKSNDVIGKIDEQTEDWFSAIYHGIEYTIINIYSPAEFRYEVLINNE